MWGTVLGFVSKPLTAWIEKSESRKFLKEEGNLEITKAKVALEVAVMQSKAERLLKNDIVDADYDRQAQMEKRHTYADEVLIVCTIVLVGAHFFYPVECAQGWAAMGYLSPPWWLEFIIVGIYISVFGLMRLFRAWNPFGNSKEKIK